jgi:hypothetical protein
MRRERVFFFILYGAHKTDVYCGVIEPYFYSFFPCSLQHGRCPKRWSYLQEKNEFIFLLDGAEVKRYRGI